MDDPAKYFSDETRRPCPVTGLTVTTRPEWDVILPDRGYKALVSLIGDRIIKADIHGYSTRRESRKTAQMFESIIPGSIDRDKGFVQIFDLKKSTGFSLASRRNYLRAVRQRKGLLGHIYYNTSPLFNIAIRIGRKLNRLDIGTHIVNDYREAVTLATKLTSTRLPADARLQMDITHKSLSAFETREYCPVTGLPVMGKPEWTDQVFGANYRATFKIIGRDILLSSPTGRADALSLDRFFEMRSRVISDVFGPNRPFFEIKDYKTARTPSKAMRKRFVENMALEKDRLVGFIGYHAPPGVRFALQVGRRLIRPSHPAVIVPRYENAVRMAVAAMISYRSTGRFPSRDFFKTDSLPDHLSYSSYQMDHLVDEILQFLANINWEIDGLDSTITNIPPDHPFGIVFEAITLIKSDLDEVTRERRVAVKELRKREKLYRQMAENAMRSSEVLKRTQEQLIQSEKMAALGSLVAGVSHEISTPLGIGVTAASFLQKKISDMERKKERSGLSEKDIVTCMNQAGEAATMIGDNLKRASDLINSFKQISVDQSSEAKRTFNLKRYTKDILQSLNPGFKRTSHTIHLDCPDEITVTTYPGALSQILTNLVMNSRIHGFENLDRGKILITVRDSKDALTLEYSDNGRGMDTETLRHIYDPFYTTRRASGGTGLGMHIVYNIVTGKLGGRIDCKSAKGKGATFLIQLPH